MEVYSPEQTGQVVREQHEARGRRILRLRDDVVETRNGVEEPEYGEHPSVFGEQGPNDEGSRGTESTWEDI